MKPSSSSSSLNKPEASLSGAGGKIPLSGFSVQMVVGQMGRAHVSFPQEFLGQVMSASMDQEVKLIVDDEPLFVGYVSGPSTEISGEAFTAGANLVHKSRDLDDGGLFSPGLHPMSTEDYSFSMAYTSDSAGTSELTNRQFMFDLTKNMGTGIPDHIAQMMEQTVNRTKSRSIAGNKNLEYIATKISDASPDVIEALGKITADGACKLIGADGNSALSQSATSFVTKALTSSMQGGQSAWNVLASMYAVFGMTIICKPDGTAMACPDYSGCKPDAANDIQENSISRFSLASPKVRTPSGVMALSFGVSGGLKDGKLGQSTAVASYFPEGNQASGGTYVTGLPGWMIPVVRGGSAEIPTFPEELANMWAKQIFHEVSNSGRTMQITMPFTPSALPGTTYRATPASSAKFLMGGTTGLGSSYSGYCHALTHSMRSDSNAIQTTMDFRNVFPSEQEDGMVDGAPLYNNQKPFAV